MLSIPLLASTSASMTGHPSSTKVSLTVDFPVAIPPVSPNINILHLQKVQRSLCAPNARAHAHYDARLYRL